MTLTDKTTSCILALTYPVIYEKNMLDGVERALSMVVRKNADPATEQEFAEHIQLALNSTAPLRGFSASEHTEEELRAYLAEIANRIQRPSI